MWYVRLDVDFSASSPSLHPIRQIINERAAMVKAISDPKELEEKINCWQIKEVFIQAENKLELARKLLEVKAWESTVEEPKPNQWKWPMYLFFLQSQKRTARLPPTCIHSFLLVERAEVAQVSRIEATYNNKIFCC